MENEGKEIWTIGHSIRSISQFIDILKSFDIGLLVDVRRYPGSRKFPHFNSEDLEKSLAENHIRYIHLEALGGRRKVMPDSVNTAWRLPSFQGYADYMGSEAFINAISILEEEAINSRTVYMCSEAVWWSCHRSLISDHLKVRGWKVTHIMNENKEMEHPYTKPARIINGQLDYSAISSE